MCEWLNDGPSERGNLVDCLHWEVNSSGQFTVASVWKWLQADRGPDLCIAKRLWKSVAPPKVQFFGWLAWRGRVKTAEFLRRIGVLDDQVSILCAFCSNAVESVSHVLLHCPRLWRVWSALVSWWDMCWVVPCSIEALLQWWAGVKLKKKERKIWNLVPLVMLWSVWKLRNDKVFNGGHPNFADLVDTVKSRIAFWAKSNITGVQYSVHDLVINLNQVRQCLG